jgi:hypothetical protein
LQTGKALVKGMRKEKIGDAMVDRDQGLVLDCKLNPPRLNKLLYTVGGDFFLVKTGRLMKGSPPPEGGGK